MRRQKWCANPFRAREGLEAETLRGKGRSRVSLRRVPVAWGVHVDIEGGHIGVEGGARRTWV